MSATLDRCLIVSASSDHYAPVLAAAARAEQVPQRLRACIESDVCYGEDTHAPGGARLPLPGGTELRARPAAQHLRCGIQEAARTRAAPPEPRGQAGDDMALDRAAGRFLVGGGLGVLPTAAPIPLSGRAQRRGEARTASGARNRARLPRVPLLLDQPRGRLRWAAAQARRCGGAVADDGMRRGNTRGLN